MRLSLSQYGIEIEKQVKLLDDISYINGDFSYSFTIPNTAENRELLGIRPLNSTAFWNTFIETELVNDSGFVIYKGYLQIESQTKDEISLSFFSGNTDWITLLNVNLIDLNYPTLTKNWTSSNIVSSWTQSSGIVFPFINRGGLLTRKSPNYFINDFQPYIYVKDAIRVILANSGIKLEGDLLSDPVYNSLITTNNSSKALLRRVDQQKVKAGKFSTQSITALTNTKITFTDLDGSYYNSPQGNWSNSEYTFTDNIRKFNVSVNIKLANNNNAFLVYVRLYVDSILVHENSTFQSDPTIISFDVNSGDFNRSTYADGIVAGSKLEVQIRYIGLSSTLDVLSGSYVSVEPTKFYLIEANQCLPDKKASEFVKEIFSIFNTVVSYDANRKILTVKKLDNVIRDTPVDISDYVERDSIEYLEFIQGYAKNNLLTYDNQSFDEVDQYNDINIIPYGHGNIQVFNDFLDEDDDLLSLDFIATWQQDVDFIGSLPRLNYVQMVETTNTREGTSVTDVSGSARFNFTGAAVGLGIVRISDSTIAEYNGDYRSTLNTAGYTFLEGVLYLGDATFTITVLDWEDLDNDDQSILIYRPSVKLTDLGYSGTIEAPTGAPVSTIGLGYFYYPDRGTRFSRFRGVGLPFDAIDTQKGLKDAYWSSAEKLLSNGLLVKYTAHLPESVFMQLDFLRPVSIVTPEENLIFLVNRITGYKGSQFPCEIELVNIQNVQLATVIENLPTSEITPDPEPPEPETTYYLADLYECNTCVLFLAGQVVEYTGVGTLKLNRWYSEGTYVAYVYSVTTGPSSYTLIDNTPYGNCSLVPCIG